jgi:hypothetical protein
MAGSRGVTRQSYSLGDYVRSRKFLTVDSDDILWIPATALGASAPASSAA